MSQSASQAAAFYRDAAAAGAVWTIADGEGYPAPKTSSGKRSLPFWSSEARARKIIDTVAAYQGFEVERVPMPDFVAKWLPDLKKDGLLAGLNWSGPYAKGYDVEPDSVLQRLTDSKQ